MLILSFLLNKYQIIAIYLNFLSILDNLIKALFCYFFEIFNSKSLDSKSQILFTMNDQELIFKYVVANLRKWR